MAQNPSTIRIEAAQVASQAVSDGTISAEEEADFLTTLEDAMEDYL